MYLYRLRRRVSELWVRVESLLEEVPSPRLLLEWALDFTVREWSRLLLL